MRKDLPSGTVTFLFTDVEGSTKLLHELGAEAYADALAEHRRVIREACAAESGVEVDTQGDAFFFAFPTAPGALAAASAFTESLSTGAIQVRVGVHTGTPFLAEEGYVGGDVHRAARIAAAGHGGQVLVSASTVQLVEHDLRDLGEHRLKDLAAAERVYQLGDGDFAPLMSLYRTNLPVPATPFLGRESELADVVELISREDVRLLTLTGPGGTGKTRLALQAAAECSDRYPDGVWWVPLAPLREASLAVPAISQALGVKEEPGRPLAATMQAAIAGRRLLLLVDNLEHLLPDVAGELRGLSTAPGVSLLLTSRERLQLQGEQVYPVPTLEKEDGISLFLARARSLDPSFGGNGAVAELCARLDHLPLALELAAARTVVFSPDQLLERLSQRLDLLKGGRDADPRQHTLRATIEWSYELLLPEEQRLFRSLSVFVGGVTYEAAEAVCGADPDTLQSLLDKSLLRRRETELGPRYWMLETIREFALGHLEESGQAEDLRGRAAELYAAFVEEAEREMTGPDQGSWWQRMTDEYPNVTSVLEWACGGGNPGLALRLTGSLWRYWWQRGHYREGRSWCERALALDGGEPALRTRAVYSLANMAMGSGDSEEAIHLLEKCLASFREEGDETRVVWTLTDLGIASGKHGRLDDERAYFERALEHARQSGYTRGVGVNCINLGGSYLESDELDRAEEFLQQAVTILRELSDDQAAGNVLGALALVDLRRGRVESAKELLRESMVLSRRSDDRLVLAHTLVVAGAILGASGDGPAAAAVLGGTAALQEEMDLALDHVEARLYEETLAQMRERGGETFELAFEEGRRRAYEETLDLALAALS
jgi:predicted ATPase